MHHRAEQTIYLGNLQKGKVSYEQFRHMRISHCFKNIESIEEFCEKIVTQCSGYDMENVEVS